MPELAKDLLEQIEKTIVLIEFFKNRVKNLPKIHFDANYLENHFQKAFLPPNDP